MAVCDIVEVKAAGTYASTESITFTAAPSEDDAIVLGLMLGAARTITTAPSGFTEVEDVGDYPRLVLYKKIAGAAESATVSYTINSDDNLGMIGYVIEGPLTLDDISFSTITSQGSATTDDTPASPLSSTNDGVALFLGAWYGTTSGQTLDNDFINSAFSNLGSSAGTKAYASKVITHPDTDIQTTTNWTTSTTIRSSIALVTKPLEITSVSTDDVIGAAENPWNITGSGFGSA